ncbi:peptidase S8/S53 domain-containing protein [Podospora didyma]|uniref:Peptidase S8/S53 domain-containing protein n=1 Tax=Podospora didyma TaxID=330526 RepID=A0AAE0NR57_9PEZI|nr:peptidase S8/S53 domain-containing protein [Podospora didyma]
MKFTTTIASLAALIAIPLALADVPITNEGISAEIVVADKYIVKYKAGVDATKKKQHEDAITFSARNSTKAGVTLKLDIDGFSGYVAELTPAEVKSLTTSSLIEYIEKDTIVHHAAVAAEPSSDIQKRVLTTQASAPSWGLGRISHRLKSFSDYIYDTSAGQNVRVYVVDTGIQVTHVEFKDFFFQASRAVWGANFITGSPNTDEYGHGTHVAGTIAGKTYGVAKKSTVVAVKVLDKFGQGTTSSVLAGITWSVRDAIVRGVPRKSVINMSLGTPVLSPSLNAAVKGATDAGLTVVVAAGNNNVDAKNTSPASELSAITVAAIDGTDYRAWFSNFGFTSVDIFGPGVSILSSYIGASNTATRYLSGTSMAAPHVAGLAAYFIAKEGLLGSVAVTNRILSAATVNAVGDAKSPNRLAYNFNGA